MIARKIVAYSGMTAAVVLLASCLSVLVARSISAPATPRAQLDLPAPEFALPDLDETVRSLRDYRGKVVVLAFMDSRCPVSVEYKQRIVDLATQYADREDFVLLKVASSLGKPDPMRLRELRVQRRVLEETLPTLRDDGATVARQYGVAVTPTFCVIDAVGTLRYVGAFDDHRDAGQVGQEWCGQAVERLLQGDAVLVRETDASGCPLRE